MQYKRLTSFLVIVSTIGRVSGCISVTNASNMDEDAEGLTTELQEACQQRGPRLYALKQLKIALCLTIGNLTIGYSMGWATPIVSTLKNPFLTPLPYLILDTDAAWIARVLAIGAIVGSLTSGFTANKFGRKPCLLFTPCFNIIGYVIIANSLNVAGILVGRFFGGVAAGSIAVLTVVYLGEIATPEIRGALIALAGIMQVFGSLLVYSLGPYLTVELVCYVCVGVSCVHILLLCYIPESPVYLVMKGKLKEARLTLHDLGRTGDIEKELKILCNHANEALLPQTNVSKRKVTLERKDIRAFFITTVLLSMQAGAGRVAVIYYARTIFRGSLSTVDPNVGTIVLGLTELCGVIMTPLLVERCGRRFMMLLSLGCCCLWMLFQNALGIYFSLNISYPTLISSITCLPLILLMLFLFTFNFGLGVVPTILSSEMYSPRFRSTLCSVSTAIAWFVLLCTDCNYDLNAIELKNRGVFWVYAVIYILGFFFVMFVVPETRGKTLMEIGYLLERHSLVRVSCVA